MNSSPSPKALLWPQLLYAMGQVAGKTMDREPLGRIWVESLDESNLKVYATDGVAMLITKIPATHGMEKGLIGWLNPADFTKKPSKASCNAPKLFELNPWESDKPPCNFDDLKALVQGEPRNGALDPIRVANFFKAVAVISQRVDLRILEKASFIQSSVLIFPGELKGLLAHLVIKKG